MLRRTSSARRARRLPLQGVDARQRQQTLAPQWLRIAVRMWCRISGKQASCPRTSRTISVLVIRQGYGKNRLDRLGLQGRAGVERRWRREVTGAKLPSTGRSATARVENIIVLSAPTRLV